MPSNAGYYVASYVVAAVVYLAYGLVLAVRSRRLRARIAAEPRGAEGA